MKRIQLFIPLALMLLLALPATAQRDFKRTRQLTRIVLAEKINEPMRHVPLDLLRLWKAGRIKGYFPNAPGASLTYNAMLERFKIARRVNGSAEAFGYCGDADSYRFNSLQNPNRFVYAQPDPQQEAGLYEDFGVFIEIIEDRKFDRRSGDEQFDIKFIRLVWSDPTGQLPDVNGVLFRWEDIVRLGNEIQIANPRNDAAHWAFAEYLRLRRFNGIVTMRGDTAMQTLQEAYKESRRDGAFTANIWTY